MATKTKNFNLIKPEATDFYDIEEFNGNADKIDAALKDIRDETRPIEHGGTGSKNQTGAANQLGVYSLIGGKRLLANTDLNNVLEPGNYFSSYPADVATMVNCPTTQTFELQVKYSILFTGGTYRTQELKDLNGDFYTRYTANMGINWSAWIKEFNTKDIIPIKNGGTGATTTIKARENLGAAPVSHTHKMTEVTGGEANYIACYDSNGTLTFVRVNQNVIETAMGGYNVIYSIQEQLDNKSDNGHSHIWSTIQDKPSTFPPSAHKHAIADVNNLQNTLSTKADLVNGVVPISQIPNEVKEVRIVADIAARNAMTGLFQGLNVYVKDASADPTVTKGGAYYLYDGSAWIKTSESESMDLVLQWANIQGKPNTFPPSAHTHTKSQVGLANVDNVKQYSENNPPPYPVTKVNNKTGAVSLNHVDVGAVQNGGVTGQDGAHQMAMSWNGSRIIVGVDNNAAVKKLLSDDDITGAISNVVNKNFVANRVIVSTVAGKAASSPITTTELNHLEGVTANIQTQLNGKISIKKLWENAKPTSSFPAQTLYIDFAGYPLIIIVARLSASGARTKSVIVPFPGNSEAVIDFAFDGGASGPANYHRTVKLSSPGPQFLTGNYSSGSSSTTGDSYVIPIGIYGIKGVL